MTAWSEADRRWMREALAEGRLAERLSPPNPAVGAVLVKDGRLIGRGHTQRTGGPHAEVMALADARSRGESTEGATAYVTLEPCLMCTGALREARVSGVVFGASDARAGAVCSCLEGLDYAQTGSAPWSYGGVEAKACAGLLQEFFRRRR